MLINQTDFEKLLSQGNMTVSAVRVLKNSMITANCW